MDRSTTAIESISKQEDEGTYANYDILLGIAIMAIPNLSINIQGL